MPKINLGLIGCNNQGREHLNAIARTDGVTISTVCDVNDEILKEIGCDFPGLELFNDFEKFIAKDLDGYVLALPHYVYPLVWSKLMSVQKPLLKEKPLGRNLKEGLYFFNECQKAGVPLVTAIQRRTHPSYVFLKKELRTRKVKEITACMHLGFDPTKKPDSWRGNPEKSGGGALLDSGYHMVDLVHFLLGPFNLIQANIWHNGRLGNAGMIDTDVSLLGKRQSSWIRIESRVGGDKDVDGKYCKKETVVVKCDEDFYEATRKGVKKNGIFIFQCSRSWENAMVNQLISFAEKIKKNEYNFPEVWEQSSVMKVIGLAYKLADINAPFDGGYVNE